VARRQASTGIARIWGLSFHEVKQPGFRIDKQAWSAGAILITVRIKHALFACTSGSRSQVALPLQGADACAIWPRGSPLAQAARRPRVQWRRKSADCAPYRTRGRIIPAHNGRRCSRRGSGHPLKAVCMTPVRPWRDLQSSSQDHCHVAIRRELGAHWQRGDWPTLWIFCRWRGLRKKQPKGRVCTRLDSSRSQSLCYCGIAKDPFPLLLDITSLSLRMLMTSRLS
jgi:hypothetical protein